MQAANKLTSRFLCADQPEPLLLDNVTGSFYYNAFKSSTILYVIYHVNPFKPNGIFNLWQLNQSISVFLYVFFYVLCLPFYAVLSVPCTLVITCWERADLLALLCVVLYPHAFKNRRGYCDLRPSVCPLRYRILNHWTKSNPIW